MKSNMVFPIKYAIMELYEPDGWTSCGYGERIYKLCGYIVSKAYLIERNTKYGIGSEKDFITSFDVVFPFDIQDPEKRYGEYEKQEPEFNCNGNCHNSVSVSSVFNSYDKAKKIAEKKNDELFLREVTYFSIEKIKNESEKIKKNFYERIEEYGKCEEKIAKLTESMIITPKYGKITK